MKPVVIAAGSNMDERHGHLRAARHFLQQVSIDPLLISPIYITEPIGPSTRYFLNGVIEITTCLEPKKLLKKLKSFEIYRGRNPNHPRWSARPVDLDIISFGNLVIQEKHLIIPHPEYSKRLFVLKPLQNIHPHWRDPQHHTTIKEMIEQAPDSQLRETKLSW
jgi:2-amino-4-hydroxy-6-hydroxymethyldihydropteridine diphosphokinase